MAKMEILKCHCGSVELELTLPMGLRICENVTVQFAAEETQWSPQFQLTI